MDFERGGRQPDDDETAVNLRAYFDRMPAAKLAGFNREWGDERVIEWDDNFKDDGYLFLPCSERDVDIAEYRRVLNQAIAHFARSEPSSAQT